MPIAFPPNVYSRQPLLGGDAGVEQTIEQMRGLVDEALRDPSIIRLATDIVRSVPAFDDYAEANALYEWVRQNIRFTKDPVNKEKLYPPAELLEIRAGDCDDISMLLGTLLMAVGYPARLMTVAASPGSPEQFSHVYIEGEVPAGSGQWIPMDPARFDSQFGIAPPQVTRSRWWSLTNSTYGDLSGLGYYPRFRSHVLSGLGSYGAVRTMGQDESSATIATIAQGTADIIRASQGAPASPFDFSASGPWQSFQTAYSPYGVPAGYTTTPGIALTSSSNIGLWLALGVGALLIFGRR
jgi:Transglutaminase-like superfamily